MGVNAESFQDVLRHPIRRKIILVLSERQNLSYMDLMGAVDAANTGKFNYHLKILADLIEKDANGKYGLTDKGRLAAQFLITFKEKKVEHSPLRMADALLIGFVGFVLTLANPAFWTFLFISSVGVRSILLFSVLRLLIIFLGLVLPGVVMWRLAVRRSNSHDAYDLYKAPLIAFAMLLPLLIVGIIFNFNIVVNAVAQIQRVSGVDWSKTTTIIIPASSLELVLYGLVFSFLGVALSELVFRFRKRLASR